MVDLGRQISVTRAQQGGFSAHILPGAVGYESVEPLIIYYPNTAPPLTTISGATVTDLESPSPYNTAIFQGVNALVAPGIDDYTGPYYSIAATDGVFSLGADPFTLEFWCRVGTSLPNTNGDPFYSAFVQVVLQEQVGPVPRNINERIVCVLNHEGYTSPDPPIQEIDIRQITDPSATFVSKTNSDSASLSAFNHVAIQRHSALAYTLHYKGQVIESWSIDRNYVFQYGIEIELAAQGQNIPGTGISQIRLTKEALYGTGAFTPPAAPFFTPPA